MISVLPTTGSFDRITGDSESTLTFNQRQVSIDDIPDDDTAVIVDGRRSFTGNPHLIGVSPIVSLQVLM